MDNLNGFRETLKYVSGAGCLCIIFGAITSIIIMEMHVRLEMPENSDGNVRTEKLLARLFELVCILAIIFAGYYLFVHYL